MPSEMGRILSERRRSNAAGIHQKPRNRHNEERAAIDEELADLEADMSVIHPGTDFENYEEPYGDDEDGIVIVIPPHLLKIDKGEDYVPTGDEDASKYDR